MARHKQGLTIKLDAGEAKQQIDGINQSIEQAERKSAQAVKDVQRAGDGEGGEKGRLGLIGAGVAGAAGGAAAGGVKGIFKTLIKFAPVFIGLLEKIPQLGPGIAKLVGALDSFAVNYESTAAKMIERHTKLTKATDALSSAFDSSTIKTLTAYMDKLRVGLLDSTTAMQNLYDVQVKQARSSTMREMMMSMSAKATMKSGENRDDYMKRLQRTIGPQYQQFLRVQKSQRAVQAAMPETVQEKGKTINWTDSTSSQMQQLIQNQVDAFKKRGN